MAAEQRLRELGHELPPGRPPAGNYIGAVQVGNLLFVAGHGPARPDGSMITGKVGADVSIEQGYEAARWVALNLLTSAKTALGDLDRIKRVVKVLGMVNAAPDFKDHPKVINGFSDLMVALFGDEAGAHARSAVGMGSLPFQIAVEVEAIFEVE